MSAKLVQRLIDSTPEPVMRYARRWGGFDFQERKAVVTDIEVWEGDGKHHRFSVSLADILTVGKDMLDQNPIEEFNLTLYRGDDDLSDFTLDLEHRRPETDEEWLARVTNCIVIGQKFAGAAEVIGEREALRIGPKPPFPRQNG